MYVYVCMCMYVCVCKYVYVSMCMYVCICMYAYVCMCMYVCVCKYVYVSMCMYVCILACIITLKDLGHIGAMASNSPIGAMASNSPSRQPAPPSVGAWGNPRMWTPEGVLGRFQSMNLGPMGDSSCMHMKCVYITLYIYRERVIPRKMNTQIPIEIVIIHCSI